jgi:hypothetical protein
MFNMGTSASLVFLDYKNFGKVWVAENPTTLLIDKALIFIDWDDTLFPTSWMIAQGMDANTVSLEDKRYIQMLEGLSSAIIMFLARIKTLGRIVIVTNSQTGWVSDCIKRYIPSVAAILETIPVCSARSTYEFFTDIPEIWKKMAFGREILETYGTDETRQRNVLSIGDGFAERLAVAKVKAENTYVKSIKLYDAPTPSSIIRQLMFVDENLVKIINHTGDLDLTISSWRETKNSIRGVEPPWDPANAKVF